MSLITTAPAPPAAPVAAHLQPPATLREPPPGTPELLEVPRVPRVLAALTGIRPPSKDVLYAEIRREGFPHVHLGRHVYVPLAQLRRWCLGEWRPDPASASDATPTSPPPAVDTALPPDEASVARVLRAIADWPPALQRALGHDVIDHAAEALAAGRKA